MASGTATKGRNGTSKKAAVKKAAAPDLPDLPPVTTGRFEEAMKLVERLFGEQTDLFIAAGQRFTEKHREGTSRPLDADEAAQIAASMAAAVGGKATAAQASAVQGSSLYAYDQPAAEEVLLAAGLATAPGFMRMAREFTALVEMAPDAFEDAMLDGSLDRQLRDAGKAMLGEDLTHTRARASAALEHFADAAGTSPGKAWSLLTTTVRQALVQAMQHLAPADGWGSSLLIDSAASTPDSPPDTSSTS